MAFPTVTTVLAALTGSGALPASMSNDPLHGGANPSTLTATGMQAGSGGYGAAWYNTAAFSDVEGSIAISALPAVSAGNGVWLDAVQQPSATVSTADGYQPEITFGATHQVGMWRYDNAVGTRIGAATNLAANIAAGDRLGIDVDPATPAVLLYTKQSGVWALKQTVTTNLSTYYSAALFLGPEEFDSARALRVSDLQGGSTVSGTTQVSTTRRVAYSVQANVAATRRVSYGVRAQVAATRRVAYGVRAAVVATRRVTYAVTANVAGTRRVAYAVAASTTQVSATRGIVYSVTAQVSATRRLRYDVLASVLASRRVRYGVLANVTAQRRVVYDVKKTVAGTRSVSYAVNTNVTGQRHVVYSVGALSSRQPTLPLLYVG